MNPRHLLPVAFAVALALAPAAALAQEDEVPPTPEVFRQMVECRTIAEDAARLACYDQQVAALQAAEESRAIVVYDREEIEDAQRGLFGLRLPEIRLFGGDDEQVNRIESTITAVAGGGPNLRPWSFRLADGSLWLQTDRNQFTRDPRPGNAIVIERAALGSFRASVNGMRPIRVTREE